MNPVSQDVKDMLVGAGLGSFGGTGPGWAIYVGKQPPDPDDVVTIYEGPDQSPADPDNDLYHPTVQLRFRAREYLDAVNRALAVREELVNNQHGVTVNGTLYLGFWSLGGLNPMGYDEQDRPGFTMNFSLMREDT